MKRKNAANRLDKALFRLQEAQSTLESVQTADGAQAVAAAMQKPLDEIFEVVERLMSGKK